MNANPKLPEKKSEKQNLTVQLEKALIRQAKIIAAEEGSSISRILTEMIEERVTERRLREDPLSYDEAKSRFLARLKHGYDLGGRTWKHRSELYDRF